MTSPLAHFPKDWFVADADSALKSTLERVLRDGSPVAGGQSPSRASGKDSSELLAYHVVVQNPRERIVWNAKSPLPAITGVARFVWMMAGSDRLADIAFYEPRVTGYTDDGISVPGSSYGHRIVQVRPGINQLSSAITRLKEDLSSRRVAITIYQPEDIVRTSTDIPCAFGLFYHVRDSQLYTTLMMRSNNAVSLLPFNIFEFSLLAEVVACEVGVKPGPFVYQAASMHVFTKDADRAREIIAADVPSHPAMPSMPRDPSPLSQIAELVKLEALLRHQSGGVSKKNVAEWIEKAERLHPYWRQLYYVLLAYVLRENRDEAGVKEVFSVFESPWRELIPLKSLLPRVGATAAGAFNLAEPTQVSVVPITSTRARQELKRAAASWEKRNLAPLTWQKFTQVEGTLGAALAARDGQPITDDDFDRAVLSIDDGDRDA